MRPSASFPYGCLNRQDAGRRRNRSLYQLSDFNITAEQELADRLLRFLNFGIDGVFSTAGAYGHGGTAHLAWQTTAAAAGKAVLG